MSVVDYFLHSLIKHLQKTQKAREKKKKKKSRASKSLRKIKKPKSPRRSLVAGRRAPIKRKKGVLRRLAKRVLKKPSTAKKRKPASRKSPIHSKAKAKKVKRVKKAKKAVKKVFKIKNVSNEVCIGEVTHFFSRIQVIVLKMNSGKLLVGDRIHVLGRKTDFSQKVKSLQIESVDVKSARKGQLVGLKISKKAKPGDQVFRLTV